MIVEIGIDEGDEDEVWCSISFLFWDYACGNEPIRHRPKDQPIETASLYFLEPAYSTGFCVVFSKKCKECKVLSLNTAKLTNLYLTCLRISTSLLGYCT